MSRRLREVLSHAKEDEIKEKDMSKTATKLKDIISNADVDYNKSLANRYAETLGYAAPNKYSWEKEKGGRKKTRRNMRKKRKTSKKRSRRMK